jgi:hypothetical protein
MIIRGPAVIKRGATVLYVNGDIVATPVRNTIEQTVDSIGFRDDREDNFRWELAFTPAGIASAVYFNELYPTAYRTPIPGTDIFGAVATDVIIWTMGGQQITFKRSALTKMPDLNLAAGRQLFGEAQYTALGALDEGWDVAGHFAAAASVAFNDTSFAPADLKTLVYTAAWGSTAPWNSIETEDGFTLTFDLALSEVPSDKYGIASMTLTSVKVSAKCVPHHITEAQVLAAIGADGTGAGRGKSVYRTGRVNSLVLTSGSTNPNFSLFNATINTIPLQAGVESNRAGEMEFMATSNRFTAGVLQPVFAVGITA